VTQGLYTAQDLAERFDCSVKTIYNLVYEGVLPRANGRGPGTRYGKVHYDLLKAYREEIGPAGNRVTRDCLAERRLYRSP
jgi:DNA-binding GntR family transcriptional regulator